MIPRYRKRETMIVFVYDTECCKTEADDPVEAVLYFHPSWVSDIQKLSLCGQLMGTTHFLSETFFKPKIISLQNGKFVLKEFGRFVLAVGTDRNLPASLLEHRAELLTSLVKLFHRDIQTIHDQFSINGQYKNLSEKLYHIFETYLPILQYNGNVFQNVPTLRLPKSASNIFLDAIQTLQSCQQSKGVLGGTILYHNKVVATQLSPEITKNLVLTDPYRIKSTAEPVAVDFYVPIGVQLIVVYISTKDYRKLAHDAQKAQSVVMQTVSHTIMPHQFPKRKIKRDKSLIFTNIPEEGTCDSQPLANGNLRTKSNANRPNHLPLKFKNVTAKDVPESGFASINFDETDSYPEFIGRTSVCSTPMTENKILHGHVMSICANPVENSNSEEEPPNNVSKTDINSSKDAKETNPTETTDPPQQSSLFDINNFFSNFMKNPQTFERRNSFTDIQDSIKRMTRRFSRSFSLGWGKIEVNGEGTSTPDFVDDVEKKSSYKTIADPTYPVFNSGGGPISKSLFHEFLESYYKSCDEDIRHDDKINRLVDEFREFDGNIKSENKIDDSKENNEECKDDVTATTDNQSKVSKSTRKSLTLPLKPLNDEQSSSSTSIFERKKLSGIQLTPLMTKLSILASNDERSSGFASWDTTPAIEAATPLESHKGLRRKSSLRYDEIAPGTTDQGYQKVELYVCGQQNMTLLLLMEEGAGKKQELVQAMFDTCVSKLGRLEVNLNQTLNVNVDGDKSEGGYSYICVDPKWDTIQRGGPWSPNDLISLEYLHRDLHQKNPITDLLIRTDDSVIYGYKCGRNEVFYKQLAHPQNGLPPPADTMGTISLRAKRRLERDHAYILF
ncbi:uncharacterized protein LOC119655874 isoform X3 [Hermetia illucens]|uniref:uncharacterized protein LOC119655874 isoform X3 n=1 Tax=Hermetia illucens TaxID=343691 RepID=UPI0018CC5C01|nr:uncharacterized protein LOC119655874 isoform X3 [Hermetia illucens]XP_037917935.1 uncharacterized protein LOC119655874 isoform X3 [Hermetia illucens]